MTRIDWAATGRRYFEAGVDRGVLYVGNNPGVPWTGLVSVRQNQSGGEVKPRYLDGIKISNRTSPENFECNIEAYTYPLEFEQCDGTAFVQNGLRITQQRRKTFGMVYRSKVGNDVEGLEFAYKIHILYNLKAEPSERPFRTLSDQNEPATFNWRVTSRESMVSGYRPSAHYVIDSRDVPQELLQNVEDVLYGTETTDPTLPTPGELIFMFDSFQDMTYDAGSPYTPVFEIFDAGTTTTPVVEIIDGGAP